MSLAIGSFDAAMDRIRELEAEMAALQGKLTKMCHGAEAVFMHFDYRHFDTVSDSLCGSQLKAALDEAQC